VNNAGTITVNFSNSTLTLCGVFFNSLFGINFTNNVALAGLGGVGGVGGDGSDADSETFLAGAGAGRHWWAWQRWWQCFGRPPFPTRVR